jgi:hypothetical protein
LIKKGYNRIKEKIRAIRKAYNKAVSNGTRSGSGKVVQEHYDELAQIWKGSPATEQLGFGISSNSSESPEPSTPSPESVEELDNSLLEQLDSSLEPDKRYTILDGDCDEDDNDAGINSYKIC